MRKLLIFSILAFVLSAAPALARQAASNFASAACPFQVPEGETEGDSITCGFLTVPEDHSKPDGATIQLAVAVIHSDAASPAPDPLIYLSGGPGDSALGEVDTWVNYPLRKTRDIILLDQRGTGYSQPALNCDSLDTNDQVQTCHDQLVKDGVNLSDYNSAQSAADVADLRAALGYDQWNIYSVSYGTRLALTVLRDHPEGVRSVVLDSVYPPQVKDWEEEGTDEVNAFNTIFQGCAADPACNQAYPDLQNVLYQTVAKLNQTPATYSATDANTGAASETSLSGDDFANALFQAQYVTANIPYIPQVIYRVSQGDYQALDDLNSGAILGKSARPFARLRQTKPPSDGSSGDFTSVTCVEEIPFANFDQAMADAQAAPVELRNGLIASVQSMYDTCRIWDVTPAPAIEAQPVSSNLPTLVLAGEYDPATPAAWSKDAAKTLSSSFFFEFPGVGHATIDGGDCPASIILAFIADPTTQPDSSCIARMTEPQFVVTP